MARKSKHRWAIVVRAVLLAALLLGSLLPLVWLGSQRAEKSIASGTLMEAERWLALLGAFSTYPLLPTPVRARIEGVACQLALAQGRKSDALEHFRKEIAILAGREINSEAKPSILALLGSTALRSGWHTALERLAAEDALPPATKGGLAERLTLFGFDPRFPVECARHEYGDQHDLLAESLLGGSWETSSPAGRLLFVRVLESNLARARLLAEALDAETPPNRSDAILESIQDSDGHAEAFLAMRPLMVEVCYGSRELGEKDGKAYGEAIDECVAATLVGLGQLRLGRLGSTLHGLRKGERRALASLREGRR
jgi:hypothetical protein